MSSCKECLNREICAGKSVQNCEHYDVPFTRKEILGMLSDAKTKNPSFIPEILKAIRNSYRINLAY